MLNDKNYHESRKISNDLHINVSNFDNHPSHLSISSWESSFDAQSIINDEPEDMNYVDLGIDDFLCLTGSEPSCADVKRWLSQIPSELINAVKHLPSYRLPLLKASHSSQFAHDLLISSPILAWLVWHYFEVMHLTDTPPLEIFNKKRTEIFSILGLLATKSSVKQLSKLKLIDAKKHHLSSLFRLFTQPNLVDAFRHFDTISLFSIRTLERYHWLANSPLHRALSDIETHQQRFNLRILNDTLSLSTQLQYVGTEHISRRKSIEALLSLHDRLLLRLNREGLTRSKLLHDEEGNLIPIPAPPIPSNDTITPIDSFDLLTLEGSKMHHCVAAYVNHIQAGNYYVYHMSEPEKVTIGLAISKTGQVRLQQAMCLMNRAPSKKSMDAISNWLIENTHSNT